MPIVSGGGGSGSGGSTLLYDFTITGADQNAIDTNVDGPNAGLISQAFIVLEVFMVTRTDDATGGAAVTVIVNNDTGANYDKQYVAGIAAAASAATALAATSWTIDSHGSGGSAGYAGVNRFTIPAYSATTFNKTVESTECRPDATAANDVAAVLCLGWRSTAAINRIKVAASGGQKLKVGSRMTIYGR